MESKNRSGAVKSKRSKRRLLAKSDNYINSNETNKSVDKYILKTRGPYVVRNPAKLNTDDNLNNGSKAKNRGTEKKDAKRGKFSSTVITTSLLGNRKFITQEIVKTKRRNRNLNIKKESYTKNTTSDMKNDSKNLKVKAKSQSSYKKKNREDDVIYVLPSRHTNYQSVTNTISMISKQDNPSNIYNKEVDKTCSGIDRIADEVLEGWIKRKEKMKSSEHTTITKEKPDEVFNLGVDFNETNSDTVQEISSTSKTEKTYIKKRIRKSIIETENNYDIDLIDQDTPNKFYIIEEDNENPKPRSRFKKPKITVKHNLKSQSLVNSNPKTYKNKDIKRNSKREFINLIKKELQISSGYKEPYNMFEALKTLAEHRNKINHISFVDGIASKTKWPSSDCDYGNPKLINSFKKFIPKSNVMTYAKIPRKGTKTKTPSPLEVKHFHKLPHDRLQVITI